MYIVTDAGQPDSEEVSVLKIRIKFSKQGPVKFIGHLDTMRYFQKLIRRSGIDIAYSEGYSPHQKMSFAQPLSVGVESNAEYMDIEVNSAVSSENLIEKMNSFQAEGFFITDAVMLPDNAENAMASVYAADYTVQFRKGYECPLDLVTAIQDFNSATEYRITKETKKSLREIDLKEFVYILRSDIDNGNRSDGTGHLFMRLSAGSGTNIKPHLLLSSLYNKYGYELSGSVLMITREELYSENMQPLIAAGEHFDLSVNGGC